MPLSRLLRSLVVFFPLIGISLSVAAAPAPRPADEVFRLSADRNQQQGIALTWSIAPGHYLYRDRLQVTFNERPVRLATPPGERKNDPNYGEVEIYRDAVSATIAQQDLPNTGQLVVTYQGCAEDVLCYPPVTKMLDPASLATSGTRESRRDRSVAPAQASRFDISDGLQALATPAAAATPSTDIVPLEAPSLDGSFALMLATFLGFGVLLAFTPCVFPMIPILSGVLAGAGQKLSFGRSFMLSGAYVLAMAVAYGTLGLFAAWSGANLQVALQTDWAVLLMSGAFFVLAMSMFGVFELSLPQAWMARLAGPGERRGSIAGAALIGFASALLVGPCVTPPLAAALLYVAQGGNIARGSGALFALGLGMGLPLLAFGLLGAKILPRSGRWLDSIKYAFGFVFLGLTIWMASRILPDAVTVIAWGILLVAIGKHYAANVIRDGVRIPRTGLEAAGLAVLSYGLIVLIAVAAGGDLPLRPLAAAGLISKSMAGGEPELPFVTVSDEHAFDTAVHEAVQRGEPVLVDFSATWCVECKVMDRTVFSQDAVRDGLKGVSLIRADLSRFNQASKHLMERFTIIGPPTILFLRPDGSEMPETRIVGVVSLRTFLDKLAALPRT